MKIVVLGSKIIPGDRVFVTLRRDGWQLPPGYLAPTVPVTVCRIVLGYRLPELAGREWRDCP